MDSLSSKRRSFIGGVLRRRQLIVRKELTNLDLTYEQITEILNISELVDNIGENDEYNKSKRNRALRKGVAASRVHYQEYPRVTERDLARSNRRRQPSKGNGGRPWDEEFTRYVPRVGQN